MSNRKYWVMTVHDGDAKQMVGLPELMELAVSLSLTEDELNKILDLAKGERLEIPRIAEIARQR